MTTKKHFILFALSITTLMFNACGRQSTQQAKSPTYDIGVVINGVRWATSNVDAPGTFVKNPEDAGMLFQWNRRKGWCATNETEGWDESTPTGTAWYAENDPCPQGWRVPTREELQSLYDAGHELAVRNDVSGRYFGTAPYRLFLPAVSVRNSNRVPREDFSWGGSFYWSSTQSSPTSAYNLYISVHGTDVWSNHRMFGFAVRCVAE